MIRLLSLTLLSTASAALAAGAQATLPRGTWGVSDPQLRVDFASRGVHVTALVAKALVNQHYGQPPRWSYFSGCSDGGREAMTEAQRYPAPTRVRPSAARYWWHFGLGAAGSVLLHEAAHVGASLAMGAHPTFRLDKGRPSIYSGINVDAEPRRQFVFSSAGLTVQAVLDEMVLDVPHTRGSALERGVLAGGIGTTLFYVTLGRNASVSDVTYMARTSSLSKTQVSLIFGGVAALHAVRIGRDGAYAHFFARPAADGGLHVGVGARTH